MVDHDPTWADRFESLRARYAHALAAVPVRSIEHVGSTSVPGLAAKPVLDIDIVVERQHVAAALAAMERVGFVSRGERGVPDRWSLEAPAGLDPTNTYVVVSGSLALRNHLAVRDVLRRDVDLRNAYGDLKRSLAVEVGDIDEYVERKSALLSVILERAGFDERDRAAIIDVNRA